jgi:hypothetical protein
MLTSTGEETVADQLALPGLPPDLQEPAHVALRAFGAQQTLEQIGLVR